MLPEPAVCQRARISRDPRFDGCFYVGVLTTGIYCRPICPARLPREDNVRYFPSSASAQVAGFRPCKRCRPETARRLPEWTLGSQTVVRGMRLIDAGYLDNHRVDDLAGRLGVSTRHLNRLFHQELAASPKNLARVRRLQLARQLIDDSNLPFSQVAMLAGYGSVRRFNVELRQAYGRSPGELRKSGGAAEADRISLCLPLRAPYHVDWIYDFLDRRSLPGVEEVRGRTWLRALQDNGERGGWLEVQVTAEGLRLTLPATAVAQLGDLIARVRRVFDLDADPGAVETVLSGDRLLARQIQRDPGLRVPGAWDGFETAVRAVLGQQVSVARARNLAVALCERYGGGSFPGPEALVEADVAAIGMPGRRGEAIRTLARLVLDGRLVLDDGADSLVMREALTQVAGIGPWTAGYIGMRVAKDPDAFPDADWVVLKVLEAKAAAARRRAEAWRPWRAYAVMVLWRIEAGRRAAAARRRS